MHALSKLPPIITMAHAAVSDLWKHVNLQSWGAHARKRDESMMSIRAACGTRALDPQSSSKAHDRADRHMPIYAGATQTPSLRGRMYRGHQVSSRTHLNTSSTQFFLHRRLSIFLPQSGSRQAWHSSQRCMDPQHTAIYHRQPTLCSGSVKAAECIGIEGHL